MSARLLGSHIAQKVGRHFSERPARSGEQDPAHTDGPKALRIVRRQALKNRVVLAIDRQQNGTAVTQRLHEQGTGHD